ncbi:MAG: antibiotic biosynthesis monooxygenase [Demequina sp.]|uniref:putative quinol monooxygenase n=1 Tax=Demequina sp. TaxID=2050685 RepID=UPI0019ABB910|nr:antibiotic biosynthesis monooxygenase [Demequina sp.]MBC7297380.1 antibiotic biosynthesis monooxygenase [Demequina sp.]
MNPVVVTAYFEPAAGKRDALVDVLGEFIPRVHEEHGCELYAIHDAPDGSIVMIEKWTAAADLEAHAAGAVVADLNAALEGLLAEPIRVVSLEPLPFGDARGSL